MLKPRTFRSMSIAKKLGLFTASVIVGIIVLTSLFLVSERKMIMEERQNNVQQVVEAAHGLLIHYHGLVGKGVLFEAEAKLSAMNALRALRYSGNEYFWINDMQPRMLMHPINPALEGKDLSDIKDPTGKHLFVEFVTAVKASGAGFVSYMWAKPGNDQPMPKVSYVKEFAPWGWIIGSSVYVDTVEAAILSRLIKFSLGALLLAAILLAIGLVISRGFLKQLGGEPDNAVGIAGSIAVSDLTVDVKTRLVSQAVQ